jgi:hypothetical protein
MTVIDYDLDAKSTARAGLKVGRVWVTLVQAAEEWNRLFEKHRVAVRFRAAPGAGSRAECLVVFTHGQVVEEIGGLGSRGAHIAKHGFSKVYFDQTLKWKTPGDWRFWREPLLPGMLHELGHVLRIAHVKRTDWVMAPRWPAARRIREDEGRHYAAEVLRRMG